MARCSRHGIVIGLVAGALAACGRIGFELIGAGEDGASPDGGSDAVFTLLDGSASGVTAAAVRFGGVGNDQGYDLTVGDGTVLVTGTFENSFAFGPFSVTSAGLEDVFVTAFDPVGTPRWARTFGGAGSDRGQGIAVDGAGQIYVCGLYAAAVDFGGQSRTASGMWDAFVASYDTGGLLRWVQTAGGVGADFAYDVAVEPSGDVLVTGYYEGAVDFGAGALPVFGMRDVFVARYDANGVLAWAIGFGSTGMDSGQGVGADAAGDVIVAGNLGGAVDFGGGPVGGTGGSFVLELSPGGTHRWSRALTAMVVWDVDVDRRDGRILLASRIGSGADFGMGPLAPPMGVDDAQTIALAPDRQVAWHREFGGTLSDVELGITVDGAGTSYSIGLGGAEIDFGAGLVTGSGDQDVFVVSHDEQGALRWATLLGGTVQDRGYGVAVAPDGAVYVTGRYAGTADFGTGPMTSAGGDDLFLVRFE